MYRVYRNRAAATYSFSYFFIFFSLQSSNIKIFRHIFFSGTVRLRRLKLGTHVDSGQMYRVYGNQAAAAYSSLNFFTFLSLLFSNIKIFRHFFSQELWGLESWNLVHTWTVGRCIVYTGIRLLLLIRPFISSFFFLSFFQTLQFFITLFSGTVKPRKLKLDIHVNSRRLYRVYQNQAAAAYSFTSSLFFLSKH